MKPNKRICFLAIALSATLLGGCASLSKYELTKKPPFYTEKAPVPKVGVLTRGYEYEKLEPIEKIFSSRQKLYDWARSQGNMGTRVMSASQGMDFNLQHLVVVSPGIQPHAGYTLDLIEDKMEYAAAHGSLHLRVNQPAPGNAYAQAVTAPYIVIQVPARSYKQIAIDYEACPVQQVAYPG